MDNGFPILDAFNDDQAFERHFGSLLDDASNQLPVSGFIHKLALPKSILEIIMFFQEATSVEEILRQRP